MKYINIYKLMVNIIILDINIRYHRIYIININFEIQKKRFPYFRLDQNYKKGSIAKCQKCNVFVLSPQQMALEPFL